MKTHSTRHARLILAVGLFALTLMAGGTALAKKNGEGKGQFPRGEGPRVEMLAKRLDLTDDQVAKIEAITESSRKDGLEMRRQLQQLRNELKGEMLKDQPSEKSVLQLNQKMGDLKTEMKAHQLSTRLKVREQLTPEQVDKMLVMGARERKGGHRGPEMRGRHGRGDRQERFGRHGFPGQDRDNRGNDASGSQDDD